MTVGRWVPIAATALAASLGMSDVALAQRTMELQRGMVITTSIRVSPKTYRLVAPASLDSAAITIRGDDITVDFAGATIEGTSPDAEPSAAAGVGIRIDGGRNVRVINARVRGYKVGLLARGTRGLSLIDNDFSYNWKPRLYSLIEHESLVDWLSHHRNDKDEWLRFGAGAYLADVRGGEIRGNRVEQGMEGIMLTRSDSLLIWNNVLSFNSGVGLGLYRSSGNIIKHNRADYNVRGYSHGFYRRGQDSADLLIYEQSNGNVVAYNSMTHGGDGLFLWAGQSTMDTGQGGANDNLFLGNDFSFAPTNGMEATFSRNRFIGNRVEGSEYGLWGGYSFDSRIQGNTFTRNRTGIAIEHGQGNSISSNLFDADSVAINLWANKIEPSDWGYPKHRDTRSKRYTIADNNFNGNRVGIRLSDTDSSSLTRNRFSAVDTMAAMRDTTRVAVSGNGASVARITAPVWIPPAYDAEYGPAARPMPGALNVWTNPLAKRDRSAIVVTEWGPFDWRSPLLWPLDSSRSVPLRLRVLGPQGRWSVVGQRGVATVSPTNGRVGDTITVTPGAGASGDWAVELEYRGEATVSPRGQRLAAGVPYRFGYEWFEPAMRWNVAFFAWTDSTKDPRVNPDAFASLLRGAPVVTREERRLDYMWSRPTITNIPRDRFAAVATTNVSLPAGTYTLRAISDDAIRVWVDDRLVIDNWLPHESAVDTSPIAPGMHKLRVEYYQLGGWVELRVDIVRGVQQAGGSPGPH